MADVFAQFDAFAPGFDTGENIGRKKFCGGNLAAVKGRLFVLPAQIMLSLGRACAFRLINRIASGGAEAGGVD